jgi:hypothetical protein
MLGHRDMVSKAAATARAAEPQILQGPIVTAGIHDRRQVRRILLGALSPSLCCGRDTCQPARSTASTSAAENSERICLSVDMAKSLLHPNLFDDAEWRRKPSPASARWQRDTRQTSAEAKKQAKRKDAQKAQRQARKRNR